MTRPVHYVAHGIRGLVFACYRRDMQAHLDATPAPKKVAWGDGFRIIDGKATIPAPLGHTDLRRVTCRECWREIQRMSKQALAPTKDEARLQDTRETGH